MDDNTAEPFRLILEKGLIPLGKINLPINSTRNQFLEKLDPGLVIRPREWNAKSSRWIRLALPSCILWFSQRNVFFTFRDNVLALVEFSNNKTTTAQGDYAVEVQNYFQLKEELKSHLGKESGSDEANQQNMETVWNLVSSTIYLACDIKTGGCGIALRPTLSDLSDASAPNLKSV